MNVPLSRVMSLLVLAICLLVQPVRATMVLATHSGTNNPLTEGWTDFAGSNTSASAVVGAWQTYDFGTTTDTLRFYRTTLSAAQYMIATNQGWVFSATLRLPDANDALDPGVAFDFFMMGRYYRALFGTTAGGDTLVGISTRNQTDTANVELLVATLPGLGFHDYSLRHIAASNRVEFWIDGSLVVTNFLGLIPAALPAEGVARFGAVSSGATGKGDWAAVEFAIIPEPSSVGLALGGLALLGLISRWRRRA